ncbi:MAG: cyanophycin synthetase, partial [Pseudomonadota bacterium]
LTASAPQRVVQISSDFALGRGVSAIDGRLYDSLSGKAIAVGDLTAAAALPGRHNHQNAAAAYAACRAVGVEPATILDAIRSFPGLPHRLELAGEVGGVRFVNDSKATNAQAAEQALSAYSRVYWIAGGRAKEEGIEDLEPLFPRVAKAYLIGEAQDAFAKSLKGKAPVVKSGVLETAVQQAYADAARSGDAEPVVLLSPACASFDQYKDFEERGDAFKALVQALTPVEAAATA